MKKAPPCLDITDPKSLFTQVFCQDFIVFAVCFDVGKAGIEFINDFLLFRVEDGHTVIRTFAFRAGNQLDRYTVGLDVIRHDGGIIEAGGALSADPCRQPAGSVHRWT